MLSFLMFTSSSVEEGQLLKMFKTDKIVLSCRDVDSGKLWGFKVEAENNESLICQVNSIESVLNVNEIIDSRYLFQKIYLHIGVCYDTFTCTVELENDVLQKIFNMFPEINIEIVCYPTNEDT